MTAHIKLSQYFCKSPTIMVKSQSTNLALNVIRRRKFTYTVPCIHSSAWRYWWRSCRTLPPPAHQRPCDCVRPSTALFRSHPHYVSYVCWYKPIASIKCVFFTSVNCVKLVFWFLPVIDFIFEQSGSPDWGFLIPLASGSCSVVGWEWLANKGVLVWYYT